MLRDLVVDREKVARIGLNARVRVESTFHTKNMGACMQQGIEDAIKLKDEQRSSIAIDQNEYSRLLQEASMDVVFAIFP